MPPIEAPSGSDLATQPPIHTTVLDQGVTGLAPTAPLEGETTEGQAPAAPFATIDGQDFATQEDMTAWFQAKMDGTDGAAEGAAAETNDTQGVAQADTDTPPIPEKPWFRPTTKTDEEITASLTAKGGVYAHEAYRAAALEFEKTGSVSDATLAATAEGIGIPLEFARNFIDVQEANRAAAWKDQQNGVQAANVVSPQELAEANDIQSVVGDQAAYAEFAKWANGEGGLSVPEAKAYGDALNRRDVVAAKALLKDFNTRRIEAGDGPAPKNITKGAAPSNPGGVPTGAKPFASQMEQDTAINDPRYAADPAYREQVGGRILVSKFA